MNDFEASIEFLNRNEDHSFYGLCASVTTSYMEQSDEPHINRAGKPVPHDLAALCKSTVKSLELGRKLALIAELEREKDNLDIIYDELPPIPFIEDLLDGIIRFSLFDVLSRNPEIEAIDEKRILLGAPEVQE